MASVPCASSDPWPRRLQLPGGLGLVHTPQRAPSAAPTPREVQRQQPYPQGQPKNDAPPRLTNRYTLAPHGDTPESKRIYDAIAKGSFPLVDERFVPPPVAGVRWREIIIRLRR